MSAADALETALAEKRVALEERDEANRVRLQVIIERNDALDANAKLIEETRVFRKAIELELENCLKEHVGGPCGQCSRLNNLLVTADALRKEHDRLPAAAGGGAKPFTPSTDRWHADYEAFEDWGDASVRDADNIVMARTLMESDATLIANVLNERDDKLRAAVEALDEMLINEQCSCIKLGHHPCSRCIISINDARTALDEIKKLSGG